MGSYVPTTATEREEMLAAIGVKDLEGLYQSVPQEMLLKDGGLNIPEGLSELEVREKVTAGEALGDVESVKAVSDVVCPVSGTVCEVNEALADAPETLNSDPYGAWIIKVSPVTDTEELLDAAAYEAHCAAEEG